MDRRKQQKKERKLTAAEQKRKEMFLEKKAALEAEGFEAHDLTISAVYANVMALVLALPIVLVLWAVFVWKNGHGSISSPMLLGVLVLFFLLLVETMKPSMVCSGLFSQKINGNPFPLASCGTL